MTSVTGFATQKIDATPTTVRETVQWLHDTLGRPALPECPAECERDYGIDGGKAPAFIKSNGSAQIIKWEPYQERMPGRSELKQWFAQTRGVGTIGGWNGQHYIGYVDVDVKSFPSVDALEALVSDWLDRYPILKTAPRFRTPSGGYRIIIAFTEKQDWVAFTLLEGGDRMGELLSKNGSHTLLPPTMGANGIAYQWEHFTRYPPIVASPQEIGIYPTRKNHSTVSPQEIKQTRYTPGAIRLEDLGSKYAQDVLQGVDAENDRSLSLTKAIHEWFGWENFCARNGIAYSGTAADLAAYAWSRLNDDGRDDTKWERIFKTVDPASSQTASEHTAGDEVGCWKKIRRLDRSVFEDKCPPQIKEALAAESSSNRDENRQFSRGDESESDTASLNPASKAERLKLDIHAYLKEPDFATRLILRGEICSTYRIGKQDFSELVMQIESDTNLQHRTEFSGEEFFNIDSDAINWLIPRFLPKGEPIQIFADPGVGKTNLATDMIHAVLAGDRFLGEKVAQPGKVLYICSDESRSSAVRRMMARGIDLLNLANLKVWTYLDINNLHKLDQCMEDWRPDMVVADSLTSICMNVGIAEKDPEFARYLYNLKNTVGRYSASLIVIHHSNKNPLAKGQHAASGTNRINAAFWGIYALNEVFKDDPESPVRELVMVKGREVEKFRVQLNLQGRHEWAEKGIFVVTDDKSFTPEMRMRCDEIYRFLSTRSPRAFQFVEIDAHFNVGKNLYRLLDKLEENSLISKRRSADDARKMVYFVPDFSTVPDGEDNAGGTPPPCNTPAKRRTPESLTQHGEISSHDSSHGVGEEIRSIAPTPPQAVTVEWSDDNVFGAIKLAQDWIDTQNAQALEDLQHQLVTMPLWAEKIMRSRLTLRELNQIEPLIEAAKNSSPSHCEKQCEEISSSPARVSGVLPQKEESLGGGVPPAPREEIECGFKVGDRIDFNGQSRQVESIRKHGDRVRLHLGLNQWVYADEAQPELVEYDEESIEDAAQYLRDAAASNDPAFVQDLLSWEMFTSLTPDSKQRIWGRLTEAERAKISELKMQPLGAVENAD